MRINKVFRSCDYNDYYQKQIGGALDSYYTGLKFQRGYGPWGKLISRYGLPIAKYLGKQIFKTGVDIVSDVSKGIEPKTALKSRLKERGTSVLRDILEKAESQSGSGCGMKRKRLSIVNKVVKKVKIGKKNIKTRAFKKTRNSKRNNTVKKKIIKKKVTQQKKKKVNKQKKLNFLD
jgi:hypothetical protein